MKSKKVTILISILAFTLIISTALAYANDEIKLFLSSAFNGDSMASSKISADKAETSANDALKKIDKKIQKFQSKKFIKDEFWKKNKWVLENDCSLVEVDDNSIPFLFIDKEKLNNLKNSNKASVNKTSKDKQAAKASSLAKELCNEELKLEDSFELDDGQTVTKWKRIYKGYEFETDFLTVSLDPENSEIVSYSKQFNSEIPSINIKITESDAIEIAKKAFNDIKDIKVGDIKDRKICIVNPNNYWEERKNIEFTPNCRLAYSITFYRIKPYDGEATVWLDAETGKILGGLQSK